MRVFKGKRELIKGNYTNLCSVPFNHVHILIMSIFREIYMSIFEF